MINKLIIDALKPLNIPVAFQKYSGRAETYITFHEYLAAGEEYEDDDEALTAHYIQVDVWSKSDYKDLATDEYDTEAEKPKEQSAKLKGNFYARESDGNYRFTVDEDNVGVDVTIINGWFHAVSSEPVETP